MRRGDRHPRTGLLVIDPEATPDAAHDEQACAPPSAGAQPAGTGRPASLLALQRGAGNAAVARLLQRGAASRLGVIQRDDGGGGGGGAPAPGAEAAPGGGTAGGASQNVKIVTDQGEQELPIAQAVAYISNKVDWTNNKINQLSGEHEMLKKQREDSIADSVIGSIADVFGGFLSMPDLNIWDKSKGSVAAAKTAIGASDPVAAGNALKEANESYEEARKQYLTYKEGNFEGADTTISVLKAIILVDAAVGAALSGGATLGAGAAVVGGEATATVGASWLITQAAVAGAMGAEGAAVGDVGDQAATGKPFNWAELAEKTGAGFASGFLSACVSGPLKDMLSESCSGYVTEELMSDADLADLAKSLGVEKLERDFLQSQLKKFIIDKIADKAGEWLIGKPIDMVMEEMKKSAAEGGAPPEPKSAVDSVAKVAAPIIAAAFKAAMTGGAAAGGSGGGGSSGGGPAPSPPASE
ncbi:MAG TPA: hypothetical protein VNV37_11685 [Solirubrobacteraceae bacterium]|nr:hypothetical protein [Solirubrobacteraceae bacterium]